MFSLLTAPPQRLSLALVFLVLAGLWPGRSAAAGGEPPAPPPLGRLVDLGGRRLHLHCTGHGSPTVIVENGNGGFAMDFTLVQPEVAKFTQICSYDRAGYAWSDLGPMQGTIEQTMDDLHLLLRKVGVQPPYVFVGASIGGIFTRAYQRRYPDEVVGLVLDDPTSDEGLSYRVDGKDRPIYEMSAADMRAVGQAFLRHPRKFEPPTRLDEPLDRLPKALHAARLWAGRKYFADMDLASLVYQTNESWRQEFIALRRLRLRQAPALGDLPLVVLGRNERPGRQKELADLKTLSSTGKLVIAKDSGHEIHLYRPDLVVQAIREVVEAARNRKGDAPKLGQSGTDAPMPRPIDAEYRKLDELATFLRARNAKQFAMTSPKGIDEAGYVKLGGIEQWVTIRGQDRDNPILLFLHGGPGDTTNTWTFALFAPWQKHFTVVQWDQRGAGRTLRKTGPKVAPTITVDRLVRDGIELAEYLCKRLGKDKIVLVGHSFGSKIGVLMARARPDLLLAYVGTAQVADETRNYSVAYEELLKKARAIVDQRAVDDLTRVGPPPYQSNEGFGIQRKWSNAFEGADQFLYATLGFMLVAPGYSMQDFNDHEEGQMISGQRLVRQTKSMGPKELGLEFAIPVYFFQGAEDFTTPTELARAYLDSIKAPRKEFVPIAGGGHFAVFMKSELFLQELVRRVGPDPRSR
jgi:pimeloyl-ACP methyl ester carboxylesterase